MPSTLVKRKNFVHCKVIIRSSNVNESLLDVFENAHIIVVTILRVKIFMGINFRGNKFCCE